MIRLTAARAALALCVISAAPGCAQTAQSARDTTSTAAQSASAKPATFVPPVAPVMLDPKANASEAAFAGTAAGYLSQRYPNPHAAEAAGYVRYTDEDQDGIITYTNLKWFADDPRHPTQLWYDAHGRFLGADYTLPVSDRTRRPSVWGLRPGRWSHFMAHMHYVVRAPDGTMKYGSMLNDDYQANGGDPAHPSAQPLVRAGIAAQASDVKLIFQLPEIWIASMWLVPNPNGAFADSDPLVKPTKGRHGFAHARETHPM